MQIGIYARKDYEFSHSLSSGERKGNSLNPNLFWGLQGSNVGIYIEGEHLGKLLKEALWKEAP